MSTFTTEAAAALPGPGWLKARRQAAAERFSGAALPTEAEEVWRYSRISKLDLDSYTPVAADGPAPGDLPAELQAVIDGAGPSAGLLVARNGRLIRNELDPAVAARGVRIGSLAAAGAGADAGPDGDDVLGSVVTTAPDVFYDLNTAFGIDPLVVHVPAGVVVEHPVLVMQWLDAADAAVFPRLVVQVGSDAEVTVLDHHGSADVAALTVPVAELDVGPAGRLRYLTVQALGRRVWQVGYQASRAGQQATLMSASVALGGDYARLRNDSRLEGKGASSELLAVYYGEGDQMHDFRTMQDHIGPHTTSDLLFKGAVEDRARGVYSGLIRVRKEARGTNAFQTNNNLVLSEGASAESVPNLEIETNDVKCSHASTVGPVDEDQRYYLESRGVPPDVAERLIVLGFFDDLLTRLPLPTLHADLRQAVSDKLDRRSG